MIGADKMYDMEGCHCAIQFLRPQKLNEGMQNNKNPDIRMPKLTKSTEFSTSPNEIHLLQDRGPQLPCKQLQVWL